MTRHGKVAEKFLRETVIDIKARRNRKSGLFQRKTDTTLETAIIYLHDLVGEQQSEIENLIRTANSLRDQVAYLIAAEECRGEGEGDGKEGTDR